MRVATVWKLLKEAAKEWDKDKCPRLGAALSYYTFFSFAPVLVIAIAIAGFFFGAEAARGQVVDQLRSLIGTDGAVAVQLIVENAWKESNGGVVATIIAFAIFLVGATGAFIELQDSLDTVWEVMLKPGRGLKGFLMTRLVSFGLIVGVGFLLLVSLVISAALAALNSYMSSWISGIDWVWQGVDIVVFFLFLFLLFSMVYNVLPEVKL
jgi:membrane protein